MDRKLVPHHSHWGAYNAVVEDGKVVGAVPFDFDPDPSPLIEAIPDSMHSPLRIARPMIRAGWLKEGRASGEGTLHRPRQTVELPDDQCVAAAREFEGVIPQSDQRGDIWRRDPRYAIRTCCHYSGTKVTAHYAAA